MNRRGSTLLEVSMTLPVCTMILALIVMGTQKLMTVAKLSKHRSQTSAMIGHLERQFRLDAHAAHSATLEQSDQNQLLRLVHADDRVVAYRTTSEGISRSVENNGVTSELHRFTLYDSTHADFTLDSEPNSQGSKTRIGLIVYRTVPHDPEVQRLEVSIRTFLRGSSVGPNISTGGKP